MRRGWLVLGLLAVASLWFRMTLLADENPHWMMRPDGEPDEEKCAVCHDEDMDLLASKEETCLGCHDRMLHSGSAEHLAAPAEQVAVVVPTPPPGQEEKSLFPLAEDGRMYCGTCHLFHDPRVSGETLVPVRQLPAHAVAQAVRRAVLLRCENAIGAPERAQVSFAPQSTGFLRLPIDNDDLCTACHRREALR